MSDKEWLLRFELIMLLYTLEIRWLMQQCETVEQLDAVRTGSIGRNGFVTKVIREYSQIVKEQKNGSN